jgi:hypothetical protein
VVADKAEDADPAAGVVVVENAVKAAGVVLVENAVKAAGVVLVENAGDDDHDAKKKIQVSSNAL